MSKIDYNKLMKKPETDVDNTVVYDNFLPTGEGVNKDNTNVNVSTNENDSVNVNITAVPIAKPKRGIRETHTTKAFYIRNDIAELINEDIRKSKRGAMTEIANALFEQYYRSQGRLK
ncbi:hypothetical protein [Paenibacillus campinasensis]|uniref:Uncharacterized protein n=1 Tax=Paenibacillus campinasensis TaxID=66347 RepID=A0A268EH27_9BACL|nr:hypothetical protein [Paenibacillus campinasensis]PAD72389.1 hypothetical protein CHH67_22365 [Paenibacillus campinasensis]